MITFGRFLDMIVANPFLAVVIVLIFGCIFVNGATDAANAIAESVGTRSIKVNNAIAMSVICNFVGLVVMCIVSTAVADTIIGMVDFGTDYHQALIALAAGCVGIVTWAVGAWALGIPTSESHALIAGLTGAALALHGNFDAVNWNEWSKVIIGLIFSTISGFIAGWVIVKIIHATCKNVSRKLADSTFGHLQVLGSAFVAMMHGAQDGQKFLSIAMLAIALSAGAGTSGTEVFPLWLQVVCAGLMAFGTAIGGRRIIKKVGMEMVKLERYQGFAASISAAASLLLSTLTGLPVSTTHTKMTAMMGAGAAKNTRSVNWGVAKDMVLAWVFTFPGCGLIGYLFAKLFLMLF